MSAVVGVVVFPGTNCEIDTIEAVNNLGGIGRIIWHGDDDLSGVDAVIVPGGFAYGDYLRPGAIARFSPAMNAVSRFARCGGPVVGICNGFQILTEAGLLPGALQKNNGLRFICEPVLVRVESPDSILTREIEAGSELTIPINHFEGNFTCDSYTLAELKGEERILFRYVDNPNGSIDNIAGICNSERNVIGLMPHPERACEELLGSSDGAILFNSLLKSL